MAKTKKSKGPKPRARKQAMTRVMRSPTLDGGAMDHVNLMMDPCNGKLAPPAYGATGGGAIMRFRTVVPIGVTAGDTAGMFHWIPGVNEMYFNGVANGATSISPTAVSVFNYLQTVASAGNSSTTFRCVAACARIITNASESNRAGICYAGLTDSQYYGYNLGSTTSVGTAVAGLPFSGRTPSKSLEVLWIASQNDVDFTTDMSNAGSGFQQVNSRNAVTFGFVGATAGSGFTIELTGVYEIDFPASNGIVSSKGPPSSSTSWNGVAAAFYKAISNAPVIVDGINRVYDYVSSRSASTIGGYAAKAAVGLLL